MHQKYVKKVFGNTKNLQKTLKNILSGAGKKVYITDNQCIKSIRLKSTLFERF